MTAINWFEPEHEMLDFRRRLKSLVTSRPSRVMTTFGSGLISMMSQTRWLPRLSSTVTDGRTPHRVGVGSLLLYRPIVTREGFSGTEGNYLALGN